jgi:hypothetical protein
MGHTLDHSIALLTRTPAALDALLRELPDAWTRSGEGGKTWSAFDIVGHLAHLERANWMPRARMILQDGDTKTFEPFDRWGHIQECKGKSLGQVLDDFAQVRAQNLTEVRAWHLGPEQLALRGRHPAFGSVTLSQLLAAWAAHDLTHLHQMTRVMAHQYRDAVGPYTAYLGVMRCEGHGG